MKPTWIVFAIALAAFLLWRRRRLEPTLLAGGAIVAVGSLVYGLGLVHLPNLEHLLIDIGEKLGSWTYLLVGALAFLETGAFVGLVAPGETAIVLGGVVAAEGKIELALIILVAWLAAALGDLASFSLGQRLGRRFVVTRGPRLGITAERLEQVEGFFARHGAKAILIGRFVGIVRAVAPFLAGASRLRLRAFLPWSLLGTATWATAFTLVGYAFSSSFTSAAHALTHGALAAAVVVTTILLARAYVRTRRARAARG